MSKYSQGREDEVLQDYFNGSIGTLLSIGENNGRDLSNSLALIENGWSGTLVEPSPQVFQQLVELHNNRDNVYCINVAVSNFIGKADFFDSGVHLNKGDLALLSSLDKEEIKRWGKTTTFDKIQVDVVDFKTLLNLSPYKIFDFISIDAEGNDWVILQQMNLKELGCKVLCIEYNSNEQTLNKIKGYCSQFGLNKVLLKNAENIIISITANKIF